VKKLVVVLLLLAAVVAGAGFWAYHSLDVVAKVALEFFGPRVAGVSVKVGEASFSTREGRGSLKNVEIGNPSGFSASRAARLGEIRVSLDPTTMTEPVILVHEIVIDSPVIIYERGDRGTNLDAIQKRIEGYIKSKGAGTDASSEAPQGASHRLVVERLSIRGAKVTMTHPGLKGQGVSFDLPDIELRDVGKRQNGITPSQLANIVTGAILARIAQRVLTSIELLRKGGVEGAIDALKGLVH
jgi:hypothetical protein